MSALALLNWRPPETAPRDGRLIFGRFHFLGVDYAALAWGAGEAWHLQGLPVVASDGCLIGWTDPPPDEAPP